MIYPFIFKTIFRDKIWGGDKIKSVLGKEFFPLPNCGETWEISGLEDFPSELSNGFLAKNTLPELVEVYMGDLVGEKVFDKYGNNFPLLIKFIDAADRLSLQVHPNDEYAQKQGFTNGKTEMWYILAAEKNANINIGFKEPVNQNIIEKHIKNGTLEKILNEIPVHAGDAFFIPAGTVHAIGKGILLAEIQQSADLTYRLYDYNRKDKNGLLRELHIEDALQSIDYHSVSNSKITYRKQKNQTSNILTCPQFVVNYMDFDVNVEKIYADVDSFVIYICTEGGVHLQTTDNELCIHKGDCVLLPAIYEQVTLSPEPRCELLEVYMP
ncbi:MAG: class I mannose-6-phosphate isomerase [Bacteroidales bacterium]|jgi:mannose-6-phosphate isomerase|nr:class I mannose-6-phosphate isomerase [Bacteroidales bacterium]